MLGRTLQVIDSFEEMVGTCVAVLRCYGKSWSYIGQATGLTAEGARWKYQERCEELGVPRRVSSADVAALVAQLPPPAAAFGPMAVEVDSS